MTNQELFDELLVKIKKSDKKLIEKPILLQSLSDLNCAIDLASHSENERSRILNYVVGLQYESPYPTKKSRDQFFDTVENAVLALRQLDSPDLVWGRVPWDLLKDAKILETKLQSISELRKTWARGRRPEGNIFRNHAIQNLYALLKDSMAAKSSAQRWSKLKINQFGQFDQRRQRAALFKATPARLISNLAKGVGINLSEVAIQHFIKTNSGRSRLLF